MRLGLLFKDKQYQDALIKNISESGSDILLDVIGSGVAVEPDALIITDAKPADFQADLIVKLRDRTIFLTDKPSESKDNCNLNYSFKYNNVSRLLADISDVYSSWKGLLGRQILTSKVIAVCSDSDAFSAGRCLMLARQIIYRQGGSLMVLPLGYINDYKTGCSDDLNRFARLMYRVRKGRIAEPSGISWTDSYGISKLMLPDGRNPIAYLETEDLNNLISALSTVFETLILDISTCYRYENLQAINNASSVICFETGRRRVDFNGLISEKTRAISRVIKLSDGTDEEFEIDEYIRDLYKSND